MASTDPSDIGFDGHDDENISTPESTEETNQTPLEEMSRYELLQVAQSLRAHLELIGKAAALIDHSLVHALADGAVSRVETEEDANVASPVFVHLSYAEVINQPDIAAQGIEMQYEEMLEHLSEVHEAQEREQGDSETPDEKP